MSGLFSACEKGANITGVDIAEKHSEELLKVAVIGAAGNMGQEACKAVHSASDCQLVGQYDLGDDLGDLGGAQVVIELTHPDSSPQNVAYAVSRGIHAVVGTTGWNEQRLADLQSLLNDYPETGVLIAPNFSVGALLLMDFAQKAAEHYPSVEVVEIHHPHKADAPSGTAARTAELIAAARNQAGLAPAPDATESDPEGARGAKIAGIPVHAMRLAGRIAHQEVHFGAPGEALILRHDSFDRASFMPGVLAGVRAVAAHPGLTVGLENYLGL